MTATWVWKKETLVDTGGVIRDWRSDPKVQRTLVCEECYEGAIRDGGLQTEEGWWMFDAEYVRSPRSFIPSFIPDGYQLQHAQPGRVRQDKRTPWTRLVGVAHEDAEDQPLGMRSRASRLESRWRTTSMSNLRSLRDFKKKT